MLGKVYLMGYKLLMVKDRNRDRAFKYGIHEFTMTMILDVSSPY